MQRSNSPLPGHDAQSIAQGMPGGGGGVLKFRIDRCITITITRWIGENCPMLNMRCLNLFSHNFLFCNRKIGKAGKGKVCQVFSPRSQQKLSGVQTLLVTLALSPSTPPPCSGIGCLFHCIAMPQLLLLDFPTVLQS